MHSERIKEKLDSLNIHYEEHTHAPVMTSEGLSHAEHIQGAKVAKAVIFSADGDFVMAVVPGNRNVNFHMLRNYLDAEDIRMASESEINDLFPDCEIGAIPPIGNLYDMQTIVDESLLDNDDIEFNTGSHQNSIHIKTGDYKKLAEPEIAEITKKPMHRVAKNERGMKSEEFG